MIIGAPVMTARAVTSATAQGPSSYAKTGENISVVMTETIGPATPAGA